MCTYNGSKYIKEQLASILFQTRLPDELVICDDGSADDTVNIIKGLLENTSVPVRLYVNEKNLGSTKNFERAVNRCMGDIIVLSDQDDVWNVDKLHQLERIFIENPYCGGVFSNASVVDDQLSPLGYTLWDAVLFNNRERQDFFHGKPFNVLLKHNVVTGATMAFRSSYKKDILPIPDIWIHDAWIILIISTLSDIIPIAEPLIKYRQSAGQQIGMDNIGLMNMAPMLLNKSLYRDKVVKYINGVKKYRAIEADRYKLAIERYRLINVHYDNKIIGPLNRKIAHAEMRANLSNNRLLRLPIIFKELILFHYAKYSHRQIYSLMDILF